jgi:N-carbamoyl-L-amino-acid hydrolase
MSLRRDAVRAVVELAHALYEESKAAEAAGQDLVLTIGKFFTDAQVHQLSKVPGLVRFTVDARSTEPQTLDHMASQIRLHAERIERQLGVAFDLGALAFVAPAQMAPVLVEDLLCRAQALDIPAIRMASGAGHDAADFARQGVPTAMIFVRNSYGSHNPMEAMTLEDFGAGTELLADAVAAVACAQSSTDVPSHAMPSG